MMDPFFMFLFTSFLMLIFLIFLSFWLPWKVNQRKNMPKFSFDTFKHFYMLNPEKWYLEEYSVNYKDIEIEFEKYRDVIKYYFFKKDLKKNKERREKEKRERELWDEMRELEEMDMEEEHINIFYNPYL